MRPTTRAVAIVHGHRDSPNRSTISLECARRVDRAHRLHVDAVLLSGGTTNVKWASEAVQMAILYKGKAAVHLDAESRSTVDNMHNGLRWAHEQNAQRVLLVTSFWHIPRVWLHWRGDHGRMRVQYVAAWGSLRYVPRELLAFFKAWRRR